MLNFSTGLFIGLISRYFIPGSQQTEKGTKITFFGFSGVPTTDLLKSLFSCI